jgi:RHH-type proline utilization regulon transcriptional repressor/proline dehydrogenase/delta 1-pyrroline-5-carboxylate dehydrogenase
MKTPESLDVLRAEIRQHTYADEAETVIRLSERAETRLLPERRAAVLEQTRSLVSRCREHASEAGTLDAFLQEFGLSNPEGVALMCLAEALLRVPDSETADRLIAEKIRAGDWQSHLGQSDSLFVNGSVWGLMEPLVRTAVVQAMRILGRQYVLGRTIEEAIERSRGQADRGNLYSFDMLGEGARTWADADRYFDAYRHAIETIGAHSRFDEPTLNDGISIKLSALHPRYEEAQRNSVLARLPSRIQQLARLARQYRLGLSIDAEESTRLDLSLTIFEQLAADPALDQWQGLGFVLQAYQKRAPEVADWLIAVARQTGRQLMVRLVKGAYWDAEIKQSQERGLVGYPVFTRKANTDLCYEVCAGRLLEAPEAIYPQFATHNAITATAVLELGRGRSFELQRLHGMGELLYEELGREQGGMPAPLRVYAPVGSHQDLLPYLVRRLLENGANSSFVNRFLDMELAVDELVLDPLTEVRSHAEHRHPRIPLPRDIFRPAGEPRDSAAGVDLDDPAAWQDLSTAMKAATVHHYQASPDPDSQGAESEITNPARVGEAVGRVTCATAEDLDRALNAAQDAQPDWNAIPAERAAALDATADLLESHCPELMYLICAEAGRTVPDALAEVREAVDFCRYYALQCRAAYAAPRALPGPTGELNELSLHGRGTFACISPWNFPLAIFMGQTAAALAAGNCVMAKPAEQTPLVAARAVELLHRAGVPEAVLQLLPGSGADVGAALASDSRVNGVVFTGSTATARAINQRLAARAGPIVPFIAETGGQNVLIADTTALPEQLVDAVRRYGLCTFRRRSPTGFSPCSAVRWKP